MERATKLRRKTPLRAKAQLRSKAVLASRAKLEQRSPLERKTRINAISKRRRAELAVLAKAQREAARRSGGRCEAQRLPHDCTHVATDFHHLQPRNRKNHVADNLLHCCRTAHDIIEGNPKLARECGYKLARQGAAR